MRFRATINNFLLSNDDGSNNSANEQKQSLRMTYILNFGTFSLPSSEKQQLEMT